MELAFSSTVLRALCEDEAIMVTRLGDEKARALKAVLADLRALRRVSDLESILDVLLSPQGCLRLSLANDMAVTATANHVDNPRDANGHIDWTKVSRLKIDHVGAKQ